MRGQSTRSRYKSLVKIRAGCLSPPFLCQLICSVRGLDVCDPLAAVGLAAKFVNVLAEEEHTAAYDASAYLQVIEQGTA